MKIRKPTPLQIWRAQNHLLVAEIRKVRKLVRSPHPGLSPHSIQFLSDKTPEEIARIMRKRLKVSRQPENQRLEAYLSRRAHVHQNERVLAAEKTAELWAEANKAYATEHPDPEPYSALEAAPAAALEG